MTSDGKPFAPVRVDDIIKQCYMISKRCNTSYNDVLDISPMERESLLRIIKEELEAERKVANDIKKKHKKIGR